MTTVADSAYRQAQREFSQDPDGLWEYLEAHKHNDRTLCIGWAIERAKRYFNMDQAQIATRTEVKDKSGVVIQGAIGKSFISAMLYGRSKVSPDVYKRLAEAMEVNPLHFYIAEGWVDIGDTAAFELPDRESTMPIVRKIMALPPGRRVKARAVVLTVLDALNDANTAES